MEMFPINYSTQLTRLRHRVSLEEQRQRQEEENKGSGGAVDTPVAAGLGDNVDLSQLSEEEQIALAMQMSLAVSAL